MVLVFLVVLEVLCYQPAASAGGGQEGRIHASDKWIRILLFFVSDRQDVNKNFSFFLLITFRRYIYIILY
jgi:hypothetical protein